MFDEPSLGLAPVIVDEMFDMHRQINRTRKTPVVIVEQNAFMAMSISSRTYVLGWAYRQQRRQPELLDSPDIKKHIWAADARHAAAYERGGKRHEACQISL